MCKQCHRVTHVIETVHVGSQIRNAQMSTIPFAHKIAFPPKRINSEDFLLIFLYIFWALFGGEPVSVAYVGFLSHFTFHTFQATDTETHQDRSPPICLPCRLRGVMIQPGQPPIVQSMISQEVVKKYSLQCLCIHNMLSDTSCPQPRGPKDQNKFIAAFGVENLER